MSRVALVATDLDGTLLDRRTYAFAAARPFGNRHIPVEPRNELVRLSVCDAEICAPRSCIVEFGNGAPLA